MIAGLRPYPKYKESGLPWLGGIPCHWKSAPGFAAFREKHVKNTGMREKTVLSLSYGRIVVKPPERLHGLVPDSFETYQIVDPGDIIIRSTDLQNDWNSLRVGLVRNRGIITSAYLCFRTTGTLSPEYGYQLLHAFDLMKVFYGLGSGLRQNLDFGDFKRMLMFVPPPEEQGAIVRFLDYANGRLERAIRAKRKVIALLHEQKQAIIHRAVTRGLDPAVPLKASGIHWLGDLPSHWRTSRLTRLATRIGDGLHGTPQYVEASPYYFINGNNLVDGGIRLKSTTRCVGKSEFRRHRVPLDDTTLLLSINGTVGSVALYRGESVILGKSASYINCGEELSRTYLCFFLQSPAVVRFLQQEVTGTTIFNLSLASIRSLPIALPPFEEQLRVVSAIEKEIVPVTTAIARIEREITLLREYRTRLVADVVTGKLDVRAAARQLPAEPAEPEAATPPEDLAEEAEAEPIEAE